MMLFRRLFSFCFFKVTWNIFTSDCVFLITSHNIEMLLDVCRLQNLWKVLSAAHHITRRTVLTASGPHDIVTRVYFSCVCSVPESMCSVLCKPINLSMTLVFMLAFWYGVQLAWFMAQLACWVWLLILWRLKQLKAKSLLCYCSLKITKKRNTN